MKMSTDTVPKKIEYLFHLKILVLYIAYKYKYWRWGGVVYKMERIYYPKRGLKLALQIFDV